MTNGNVTNDSERGQDIPIEQNQCVVCEKPIQQKHGHRRRLYCGEVCKQRAHRREVRKEAIATREQQQAALRFHWEDYSPELQQVLADIMQLGGVPLAERATTAIEGHTEQLRDRMNRLRPIETRFRLDTKVRHFKTWVKKHAFHPHSEFVKCFLADGKLPLAATRTRYEYLLGLGKYTDEDILEFHEWWKALLIDHS